MGHRKARPAVSQSAVSQSAVSQSAVSQSAALKTEHAFKQLPRPAKDSKLKSRARQDPISRLLRGEAVE